MRQICFCTIAISFLSLILPAKGANTGINPADLSVKVYGAWISTSGDCSNAIEVFNKDNAEYKNMLSNPMVGSGNPPDGEYQCLIMRVSDQLKFTPESTSTSGNCVAGTQYTLNVCQTGNTSTDVKGNVSNCTSNEDIVYVYLSTASTSDGGTSDANTFAAPTATVPENGLKLSGTFKVAGGAKGAFVVDGTGKVEDSGSCDMQPPAFSFR